MRRVGIALALLVGTIGVVTAGEHKGEDKHNGEDKGEHKQIAILDDCDPRDPNWNSVGGCTLEEGDVTLAEFNAFLASPLSSAVIGHSAWRFDPAYLKIERDETVRVRNEGGRLHTFTEVANCGGGRVPALSFGLTHAPECVLPPAVDPNNVPPGAGVEVSGLTVGNHRFQCCIHSWMRMLIKVKADD